MLRENVVVLGGKKMDKDCIIRSIEESNRAIENDTMLTYVRTHKNRGKNSLKSLAKKFGINANIELSKEN